MRAPTVERDWFWGSGGPLAPQCLRACRAPRKPRGLPHTRPLRTGDLVRPGNRSGDVSSALCLSYRWTNRSREQDWGGQTGGGDPRVAHENGGGGRVIAPPPPRPAAALGWRAVLPVASVRPQRPSHRFAPAGHCPPNRCSNRR